MELLIYIDTQPCVVCAKMIVTAGRIVTLKPYPEESALSIIRDSGILIDYIQTWNSHNG